MPKNSAKRALGDKMKAPEAKGDFNTLPAKAPKLGRQGARQELKGLGVNRNRRRVKALMGDESAFNKIKNPVAKKKIEMHLAAKRKLNNQGLGSAKKSNGQSYA